MQRVLILALAIIGATACTDGTDVDTTSFDEEFAAFMDVVIAHEEAIASCMGAQGFSYVVALPADVAMEEAALRAELEGRDPGQAVAEVDVVDPLQDILGTMSESERAAWEAAYWGEEGGDPGCYHSTYEAVWGIDLLRLPEEIAEATETIDADPRVIEAESDYFDCMSERGYELDDIDSGIHALIFLRRADLPPRQYGDEPVTDPWEEQARADHDECRAPYEDVRNQVHLEVYSDIPGYGPREP